MHVSVFQRRRNLRCKYQSSERLNAEEKKVFENRTHKRKLRKRLNCSSITKNVGNTTGMEKLHLKAASAQDLKVNPWLFRVFVSQKLKTSSILLIRNKKN